MNTPQLEFVPPEIVQQLAASAKPYTLVLYYKDVNYGKPDTKRIMQAEHMPYLFKLREAGVILISMPVYDDSNPDLRALGIFASADKTALTQVIEQDPVVSHKILRYQMLSVMGMKGDTLV